MGNRSWRILVILVLVFGVLWHFYAAIVFQSRAWIDEIVALCAPAFRLLHAPHYAGIGEVSTPLEAGLRSWIPPLLLAQYLKLLSFLGINHGSAVLPIVRIKIASANALAKILFAFALSSRMKLKRAPLVALLLLLFTPEYVHYATTADLSVVAMPLLLLGLSLELWDRSPTPTFLSRGAALSLTLSALVRFQYGVFPLLLLAKYFLRREWRKTQELLTCGLFFLVASLAIDSWMYGTTTFPLWNYFRANTTGLAAHYGTTPFYFAFELLWRWMTEPAMVVAVLTFLLSFRKLPFITVCTAIFFGLHAMIGHKEYRFFYSSAILFSGIAGVVLQKWFEDRPRERFAVVIIFACTFAAAAVWRGVSKVGWREYEIPSRLETYAGSLSDAKGLLVYGWNGIHNGGGYTFYRNLPYLFLPDGEPPEGLRDKPIKDNFNLVITRSDWPAPCAERVRREGDGTLYRCTRKEVRRFY
jgi:hypothetical protein